ncbi:unnamed protein product [Durusdinium trenchii]|uniref:DUF7869 domain-containing protein n=1 Tax=Durusdinium trenchii TaxID=1381693 RepID=A0ABP0PSB0_9DINO
MEEYRVEQPKHPSLGYAMKRSGQAQWPHILGFFWILYISAAEILPDKFVMPKQHALEDHEEDSDFEERYCNSFLKDLDPQFQLPSPEHLGPGSFKGPRRYLEHAQPIDLFYQYKAHETSEGRQPASLSTFMRCFKKVFDTHLKFREKCEHAQCDVCGRLKRKIKEALCKSDRLEFSRQYGRHILSQWLDRQVYWKLRALSQSYFHSREALAHGPNINIYNSLVTIICDGMDQSKLRTPRFGYKRLCKGLEPLYRPTLHLAAVWLHGLKLLLPISDESLKKDSETQIELLVRGLQVLYDSSPAQLPAGLHIQQDNCAREGKNRYVAALGIMLVALGIFRYCSLGFLRKAHSHEDVDQVFGQISRLLRGKCFNSPEELIKLLNQCAGANQADSSTRLRGTSACAFKLDQAAKWKAWVRQLGIVLKGRVHLFKFVRREDIEMEVFQRVAEFEDFPFGRAKKPGDICLIAKRWLGDTEVLRLIALVSEDVCTELRTGAQLPSGVTERRAIGHRVVQNIHRYVPRCQKSGDLNEAASRYLLGWADRTLQEVPRPAVYSILNYRWDARLRAEPVMPGTWVPPRRLRHFDLTIGEEGGHTSDSESDNAPVDLPLDG